MLSANSHFRNAVGNCLLFIILVLIETSHGIADGRELSLLESDTHNTFELFSSCFERAAKGAIMC